MVSNLGCPFTFILNPLGLSCSLLSPIQLSPPLVGCQIRIEALWPNNACLPSSAWVRAGKLHHILWNFKTDRCWQDMIGPACEQFRANGQTWLLPWHCISRNFVRAVFPYLFKLQGSVEFRLNCSNIVLFGLSTPVFIPVNHDIITCISECWYKVYSTIHCRDTLDTVPGHLFLSCCPLWCVW